MTSPHTDQTSGHVPRLDSLTNLKYIHTYTLCVCVCVYIYSLSKLRGVDLYLYSMILVGRNVESPHSRPSEQPCKPGTYQRQKRPIRDKRDLGLVSPAPISSTRVPRFNSVLPSLLFISTFSSPSFFQLLCCLERASTERTGGRLRVPLNREIFNAVVVAFHDFLRFLLMILPVCFQQHAHLRY